MPTPSELVFAAIEAAKHDLAMREKYNLDYSNDELNRADAAFSAACKAAKGADHPVARFMDTLHVRTSEEWGTLPYVLDPRTSPWPDPAVKVASMFDEVAEYSKRAAKAAAVLARLDARAVTTKKTRTAVVKVVREASTNVKYLNAEIPKVIKCQDIISKLCAQHPSLERAMVVAAVNWAMNDVFSCNRVPERADSLLTHLEEYR